MREVLYQVLEEALKDAQSSGELRLDPFPAITFEVPKVEKQGDLATPLAMSLAAGEQRTPRQIAEIVVKHLKGSGSLVEKVEIAEPGYINFFLQKAYWHEVLQEIIRKGNAYGRSEMGGGERVQVEFVSANPTGPLHVGHGRGAAVGDVLANLLEATGYRVWREYYINDAGTQMDTLGRSVLLRYQSLVDVPSNEELKSLPEDCYQGEYIAEIALELTRSHDEAARGGLAREDLQFFKEFSKNYLLERIRSDLRDFGVEFDAWMSERQLFEEGVVDRALSDLRKTGHIYEEEGAQWLKTTPFGDDKDRVLLRSSGQHTYFASDIAYHHQKYEKGFARVIDIWGADHHGYIPRMKAAMRILGHDTSCREGAPQVLVIQLVNLLRSGKPVAMSKRAGEFVTLREVFEEVGQDAARFIFLMRRCDSPLDFDLELAVQQSTENPVYYVQYAHARVCSVEELAKERGMNFEDAASADLNRLEVPEELALMKQLSLFPGLIESSVKDLEPHRLTFYLQHLASLFHNYYNHHRILSEDLALCNARLVLALAVKTVIANALGLLGVEAPRRM